MWLTTYFIPANHFTVCMRFPLIFPITFSVVALRWPILPRQTPRHPVQQPHRATLSSRNRMLFVPLHLNIFEHCLLGFQCPFPHGASCMPVHIHQHSFQMVPFHWSHPGVGYSFLRSDSTCVLLAQPECPHSVLYWVWNQTSPSITNTYHGVLYTIGV